MSSDDPFGGGGGGGDDWGQAPAPPTQDENIDMNYGQPLPNPTEQPPSQPPVVQEPGQMQAGRPKLEQNDIIALVLTFFFPGVGHFLVGQSLRAIVLIVGWVFVGLPLAFFTCGIGGFFLWIPIMLDVWLVAMTNKYRQVGDWEFFPDFNKHLGSG